MSQLLFNLLDKCLFYIKKKLKRFAISKIIMIFALEKLDNTQEQHFCISNHNILCQ